MRLEFVRPTLFCLVAAAVATLVLAQGAAACPFCDGGPSGVNETWSEIFGGGFWRHLLAAAAPFAVVLGVVAVVLRGAPLRPGEGVRREGDENRSLGGPCSSNRGGDDARRS